MWQRPQQFISRLSQRHKILFVETIGPDPALAAPLVRFSTPANFPNVTILRLQFPTWQWSNGPLIDRERRRLVQEFIQNRLEPDFKQPVQWFYDPMAVPAFLGQMDETLNVYDCMDELSNFRCAPPEIQTREATLLKAADLVFAGGRKLHAAKSRFNDNCHFFGCGVEVAHFAKAREAGTIIPNDLASLPQPVLGYFGVVDERMDYELLTKLATAHPEWSIAMVGPVLKVDPTALPSLPNLRWLGARSYNDLPAYCKGFAACLMPFALNEATEFINPTKALEYLAAGRPVISSAIPDVISNFATAVKIAKNHDEFIARCREAIEKPDAAAIERGLRLAAENTWETIVARMEEHVSAALAKKFVKEVAA